MDERSGVGYGVGTEREKRNTKSPRCLSEYRAAECEYVAGGAHEDEDETYYLYCCTRVCGVVPAYNRPR